MTRRFAIPASFLGLALAACGSKPPAGGTTGGSGTDPGTGSTDVLVKQTVLSFGTTAATGPDVEPPRTRAWLEVTDETGASQSFPIDTFDGNCSAEAGGAMGALGTLRCWWAGAGANVIAVLRGPEIIILRQWVEKAAEEPLDYEELSRVTIAYGAKVVFSP
jgi:hypothetical protein